MRRSGRRPTYNREAVDNDSVKGRLALLGLGRVPHVSDRLDHQRLESQTLDNANEIGLVAESVDEEDGTAGPTVKSVSVGEHWKIADGSRLTDGATRERMAVSSIGLTAVRMVCGAEKMRMLRLFVLEKVYVQRRSDCLDRTEGETTGSG